MNKSIDKPDADRIRNWCQRNGFTFDARNNGVVCKWGSSNLVFSVSADGASVTPDYFAWTPHVHNPGHPAVVTILPYPGQTTEQFLQRLEQSHRNALAGINGLGKAYDQDAVWRIAQREFLQQKFVGHRQTDRPVARTMSMR